MLFVFYLDFVFFDTSVSNADLDFFVVFLALFSDFWIYFSGWAQSLAEVFHRWISFLGVD